MNKKYLACCLILIELIIQIAGTIYYEQTPQFIWSFADGILILVPLIFGILWGILCFWSPY